MMIKSTRQEASSFKMLLSTILFFTLLVAYLPESGGIAVMSVDLGSEWLKIGIVKPGVPMEIALNVESKRKTPVVVAMKGDERLFSAPAMNIATKQPAKAFLYLSHIIGKKYDSPAVELYKKRFPFYKLLKDEERGTVLFEGEDSVNYSVEELVAMVLNNSKSIAENFAGHKMKDIVITVPSYFTQSQRRCLIVAANITGLNVLQLMNDNTAVALNYGIFRSATFNSTVRHIMFYDMGATHTTVTIVGYSTTKVKDRGYAETVPQLVIKGVGFDTRLGGLEMDLRLRDHLAEGFKKKYSTLKSDITKNPRSMAKLLKEAKRVRQVLSPNTEITAQIEGLFEEKDFKMKVTRAEFETLCEDLFQDVSKPIKMAFDASSMTKDDIETVILMGGGSRMPKVQEVITNFVGVKELGKSINTDEAAALGAVYKAASMMVGFKVKRFIVKDLNMYPVDVQFERTSNTDDTPRLINRNLYHRLNPLPQKKIMTFNRKLTDFDFNISYGDLSFMPKDLKKDFDNNVKFAHVKLTGVGDAHKKNEKGNPKGVKAFYQLDESGILSIEKIEAHFEKTPAVIKEEQSTLSKIGSKISDFFGSLKTEEEPEVKTGEETPAEKTSEEKGTGDEKKDDKSEAKTPEKETPPKVNNTTNATSDGNSTKGNETDKAKPPENVVVVETILFNMESVDIPKMSQKTFDASVVKLSALEARDQLKKAVEKARNYLESYISEYREKLDDEEYQKLSSTEEREKITKDLTDVYNWFDEDGWEADEGTLKKKLKFLRDSTNELRKRAKEYAARPKAIEGMLQSLNISNMFIETMSSMPDAKEIYKEKDRTDLVKVFTDTKGWFMYTWKIQNETSLEKNPVLLVKDIEHNQGKLDREMMYLINKAKYYVPPPKPKNATTKNTTKGGDKKPESGSPASNKTEAKDDDKQSTQTKDDIKDEKKTDEKKEKKVEESSSSSDGKTAEEKKDENVINKDREEPVKKEKKVEESSSSSDGKTSEEKKDENVINKDKEEPVVTEKSPDADTTKEKPSSIHTPEDEL